jgi:hypothetical protein
LKKTLLRFRRVIPRRRISIRRNRIITDEECLPILSNPLDPGAKAYLSAIRAAAIYVSIDKAIPTSVGATLDLEKALRHIQKSISPSVRFGWIAWASSFPAAAAIAQTPEILTQRQDDGAKVAVPLAEVVRRIETIAKSAGTKLSPHDRVLERAQIYARHLEQTLAELQQSGRLAEFNQAYKAHRLELVRSGKAAPPYWAVLEDLRAVIVRSLIANACSSVMTLVEIRKAFPWFTRSNLTSLKN